MEVSVVQVNLIALRHPMPTSPCSIMRKHENAAPNSVSGGGLQASVYWEQSSLWHLIWWLGRHFTAIEKKQPWAKRSKR